MGNQGRQTDANAEEPVLLGDNNGILEFDGRNLLARSVDVVGNTELRQGPTTTGDGNWAWSSAGEI